MSNQNGNNAAKVYLAPTYRPQSDAPEIPENLRRKTVLRGTGNVTQMHYAKRGEITPEMEFIAIRENVDPEFVRFRSRAGPRHHPGKYQPPRKRTHDHRAQLPRQSQFQYWQLGGHVIH